MHHRIHLHTLLSLTLAPSLFQQVHSLPTPSFFYPPNPPKHQQQIFTSLHLSVPSSPSTSSTLNNNNLHTNANKITNTHDRESENRHDGTQGHGTITMFSSDLDLRIPMSFSFTLSSDPSSAPSDSSTQTQSPQLQKPQLPNQNIEVTQLSDLTAYLLLAHPSGISFTPPVQHSGVDAKIPNNEMVTSHVLADGAASVRIAVSLSPRIEQEQTKTENENKTNLKDITNNEIREAQKELQKVEGEEEDNVIENDTWRLIIRLMHETILALRKEIISRGERRGFESVRLVGECEGVRFDGRWHFAGR